ncbi:MAG: hypothetical protein ACLSFJ_08285 [Holdemania filiformis]
MDPEEPEIITCDCGHECEKGEEHRINGETLCPKCYAKYRSDLIRKMETLFRGNFTEDDLTIIYDEDLLSEVNL